VLPTMMAGRRALHRSGRLSQTRDVATPYSRWQVAYLFAQRNQRTHILELGAYRIGTGRTGTMYEIHRHRLTDHSDPATACDQTGKQVNILTHLEAQRITAQFQQGGARQAQGMRVAKMVGHKGFEFCTFHHHFAAACSFVQH
jgi:hypothetical protein